MSSVLYCVFSHILYWLLEWFQNVRDSVDCVEVAIEKLDNKTMNIVVLVFNFSFWLEEMSKREENEEIGKTENATVMKPIFTSFVPEENLVPQESGISWLLGQCDFFSVLSLRLSTFHH